MRGRIGIVALILSVALLAAVPVIRSSQKKAWLAELKDNGRYNAALYYAHVQAVDRSTSESIVFQLKWKTDDVSPFFKGSGPAVVESLSDGSKILSLVGVYRSEPLRLEVRADGFDPDFIDVEAQSSGILKGGKTPQYESCRSTKTVQVKAPNRQKKDAQSGPGE